MSIIDLFAPFYETIFLKEDSSLEKSITELEKLQKENSDDANIIRKLYYLKAGLAGEQEVMYQLKKANIGMYVLRDVFFSYDNLTAQVDFIIVTPWCCYFVECKNFSGNITINEQGDFIREYYHNNIKKKAGVQSPLRQVEAQMSVYKKIWYKNQGTIRSNLFERYFDDLHRTLVVVANGKNILNMKFAPKEIKNKVVKADGLIRKLEYDKAHSDKKTWSSKKEMAKWAKFLLDNSTPQNMISSNFLGNIESLKEELILYRTKKAKEKNIPAYYIFNNEELEKLLDLKPNNIEELKKVLPEVKVTYHGNEIINIIKKGNFK